MTRFMQWLPAIQNYMEEVRLKYQHVLPTSFSHIYVQAGVWCVTYLYTYGQLVD